MNLESQIIQHKELSKKIEELEEQRKALGLTILRQMTGNSLQLGNFVIRRCNRLSIKLSVENARMLNAVKMEEIIDKDKIKALHHQGRTIEGVSEIQYIQITTVKTSND